MNPQYRGAAFQGLFPFMKATGLRGVFQMMIVNQFSITLGSLMLLYGSNIVSKTERNEWSFCALIFGLSWFISYPIDTILLF